MRLHPLFALPALACNPDEPPVELLRGSLGGRAFAARTVVFDEVGPAPGDTAEPTERTAQVVLVDSAGACPLLEPLYHLAWLRCESACEGLFAEQEAWPAGPMRTLWIGVTAGASATGYYEFALNESPGVFTARYRAVDLSPLMGLDAKTCLTACTEDHDFLWTATDDGQWGELQVETWGEAALEGSLNLLLSAGELEGAFAASRCEMGLY